MMLLNFFFPINSSETDLICFSAENLLLSCFPTQIEIKLSSNRVMMLVIGLLPPEEQERLKQFQKVSSCQFLSESIINVKFWEEMVLTSMMQAHSCTLHYKNT